MRHLTLKAIQARRDLGLNHGDWELMLLAVMTAMDDDGLLQDEQEDPHSPTSLAKACGIADPKNGRKAVDRLVEKGALMLEESGGRGQHVRVVQPSLWVERCVTTTAADVAEGGMAWMMYDTLGHKPGANEQIDRVVTSVLLDQALARLLADEQRRVEATRAAQEGDAVGVLGATLGLDADDPDQLQIIGDLLKRLKRRPAEADRWSYPGEHWQNAESVAEGCETVTLGDMLPKNKPLRRAVITAWGGWTSWQESDECEVTVADDESGAVVVGCHRDGEETAIFTLSPTEMELWNEEQISKCWRNKPETFSMCDSRQALKNHISRRLRRGTPLLLWRKDLDVPAMVDLKQSTVRAVFAW